MVSVAHRRTVHPWVLPFILQRSLTVALVIFHTSVALILRWRFQAIVGALMKSFTSRWSYLAHQHIALETI